MVFDSQRQYQAMLREEANERAEWAPIIKNKDIKIRQRLAAVSEYEVDIKV